MDPVTAGLLVGGTLVPGVLGALSSSSDRQQALQQNQKAVQQWLDVNVPDPAQQQLILQRYVQTGQLSPELEEDVKQGQTNYNQIATDPQTRQSMIRALSTLQDMGNSGGLTFQDKANLADANARIADNAKSQRDTITNNMRERGYGMSNSGLELQSQLAGAQNDANMMSQARLSTLSSARQRALDSIINAGNLGLQMNNQDFSQQAQKAQAQDAIDRFNSENLQGVNTRNANRINEARQQNLSEQQRVADQNVGLSNQEQQWNKVGRFQQNFDNQAQVASGRANAYTGNANAYMNNANQVANQWSNIGTGTALLGSTLSKKSNNYNPNDIPPVDNSEEEE